MEEKSPNDCKIVFKPTFSATFNEFIDWCLTSQIAVSNGSLRDFFLQRIAEEPIGVFFTDGTVQLQNEDGSAVDMLLSDKLVIGDSNYKLKDDSSD